MKIETDAASRGNPLPITASLAAGGQQRVSLYSNPDPYMIKHEGVYYCYSTGWHGVNVLRSDGLKTFEHLGFALEVPGQLNYWAPSVLYYQGVFYMYYSSVPDSLSDDPFAQRLKVAVSDSPLGPFVYRKQLFDDWTIDSHIVEKGGGLHLFFAAKNGNNTVCFYQKMGDPETVTGKRRQVLYPTRNEELYNDGSHYCLEGPFYFEHAGTGYLMYSGSAWDSPDYFVSYATCDAGAPLEEAVFSKYPDEVSYRPVIGSDSAFTGMGHNSIIEGPHGELLIVYHGRPRETEGLPGGDRTRRLCISRIRINGREITAEPNKSG